tara:strand:- start:3854 stop:4726 length:873 start_codon:yes stop_codon:yes gene_type:complete
MKIKHSKYKNTGILFELLVRQITADTLKGDDSPAIGLLKKYFVKSELGREYKLYEAILKSKVVNESRATMFVNTALDNSIKFNKSGLKRQKYNLINEIKNHYDLSTFFGAKIKDYKELAALYTLIEGVSNEKDVDTKQLVENKITLIEFLTNDKVSTTQKDLVMEEYATYDKDTRILTYKILLERFNDKHNNLTNDQKQVLKEFINSVDSTPGLRKFYNQKITELKDTLNKESKLIKDKATQIKTTEVAKFLTELSKTDNVNSDNLVDLLQYYDLVNEIKTANGKIQIKA